ncbi:hypothetical protein CLV59_105313 [Chitinophaga dinghuensis]|uniref:DinB family protein n=1 Tax=Chitinophaga dinghuensis TaxID=1539050 RepID=A0A327VZ74_9BACT|nr:DUF1572 domain-containing protein [Chitinophaga dinghuensis]RAJ80205.1 hypothetical protein CLV59_105313 [Chitinophaga dinghuensis]
MTVAVQIAKHFRDVHFGGNWTSVNLKDTLADISWEEANIRLNDLNTIAVLVFHMNYYVRPILKVLQGDPLVASDKQSFDVPAITTEEAWKTLVSKMLTEAEELAVHIAALDESKLDKDFDNPKYGNYYRNLSGLIEHTHYHLGQITILKKMIRANALK